MELTEIVGKIDLLRQEIAQKLPLTTDVKTVLDRKFRLEFNYNSNHIEGNTLSYGETMLYLLFDKTTGDHIGREYEEMKASDAALRMIIDYANDLERPLTETFIKQLHSLILVKPYWADAITPDGQPTRRLIQTGEYKSQPNSVRLQNGELFHYATPQETPMLMSDLVAWYKDEQQKGELHPVILAALLHYKFVRIHPFDDGNGRMCRLLMNYVLYAHQLPPIIIKSVDKHNYLFALQKADAGNISAFVIYIAKQLLWSLDITLKAANGQSIEEEDDMEKEISLWKKELKQKNNNSATTRTGAAIRQLYLSQLKPLLHLYNEKLALFADLFGTTEQYLLLNELTELPGTEEAIDNVFLIENTTFIPEDNNIPASIKYTRLLQNYKKESANSFFISASVSLVFHKEHYEITTSVNEHIIGADKTKIYYKQQLTEDMQNKIVTDVVRTVFEYMKRNTENETA